MDINIPLKQETIGYEKRWNFSIIISWPFFFFSQGRFTPWKGQGSHTKRLEYSQHPWSWLLWVNRGCQQPRVSLQLWVWWESPCSRISQPVSSNQCGLFRSILWTAINKGTLCLISLMDITFCLQLYLAKACRWLWTLSQWLGLDGSLLACSPAL